MPIKLMNAKRSLVLCFIILHSVCVLTAFAQGTALTYQGRLMDSNSAFTGTAEFQATLWSAVSGGTALATNSPPGVIVGVTNGLFVLPLDFGANFPGADRWLQIEVRTTIGPFTLLSPRQKLTAAPYAITAGNLSGLLPTTQLTGSLPSANLGGNYSGAVEFNNTANIFNGMFSGGGAGLSNVNATALGGLTASNFWQLGGNNITSNQFFGSINWQPLNFKVGGYRALRLEFPDAGSLNNVSPTVIGGNEANHVVSADGFVRGGVIGGGGSLLYPNVISNTTSFDTIGGGWGNVVSNWVNYATIGGGQFNQVAADEATAAGGGYNQAVGFSSAIGGGGANTAAGSWSTIPGGRANIAAGDYAFAAGRRARANDAGSFVWADSQGADFSSTTSNEFNVRASGGVRIESTKGIHLHAADSPMIVRDFDTFTANAPANKAGIGRWGLFMENSALTAGIPSISGRIFQVARYDTNGTYTQLMRVDQSGNLYTTGAINPPSDRNAKENFRSINPREVLEKVAALPIAKWNYKVDPTTTHLGPVAQDFHSAFTVGTDDKHIATVDADGVALAAIQGLNEKVEAGGQRSEVRIQKLEAENTELKQRLEKLERLFIEKSGGGK